MDLSQSVCPHWDAVLPGCDTWRFAKGIIIKLRDHRRVCLLPEAQGHFALASNCPFLQSQAW